MKKILFCILHILCFILSVIFWFFVIVMAVTGSKFSDYWLIYLIFIIPACVLGVAGFLFYKKWKVFTRQETPSFKVPENDTIILEEQSEGKIEKEEIRIVPTQSEVSEQVSKNVSDISSILPCIMQEIPESLLELLWIKGGKYSNYNAELKDEPSLIDVELEIERGELSDSEDIGYYPSYRNLSPKHRYKYLSWLKDISHSIPIGYVFILYYGLERHLLYGKVELAFNMIVELRKYHDNNSFNNYSADALLISALYHKRIDLIEKINLNRATPALTQFVVASLTGKLDADHIIKNCRDVGFTNQRYIKSDFDLFKNVLTLFLIEKFGIPFYIVPEEMFDGCTKTFPLVIANYSLNIGERIANAPDLTSNVKYRDDVFRLLYRTHEEVKRQKKEERAKK